MKKILFGIITILGIGLSFCSAWDFFYGYEPPNLDYDFSGVSGYVVGGYYNIQNGVRNWFFGAYNSPSSSMTQRYPFYVFSVSPIDFLSDYQTYYGYITVSCSRFSSNAYKCLGEPSEWISYIPITSPKFKVNYGNTSYEYELEDNLEIHLKSPVIMSGSYNYIYDGPTGISLFYNNTSDFYSKDKLYLKSMYWYNKNIFTPICL